MQVTINETIDKRLQELKQIWRRHNKLNETLKRELRELTNFALKNTSKILTSVNGINKKAENVDMSHAIHNAREYGYWRFASYYILQLLKVIKIKVILALHIHFREIATGVLHLFQRSSFYHVKSKFQAYAQIYIPVRKHQKRYQNLICQNVEFPIGTLNGF